MADHTPVPTSSSSGIVSLDTQQGEIRVIPASRRADGSVRKERVVRAGYVPPEDVPRYRPPHASGGPRSAPASPATSRIRSSTVNNSSSSNNNNNHSPLSAIITRPGAVVDPPTFEPTSPHGDLTSRSTSNSTDSTATTTLPAALSQTRSPRFQPATPTRKQPGGIGGVRNPLAASALQAALFGNRPPLSRDQTATGSNNTRANRSGSETSSTANSAVDNWRIPPVQPLSKTPLVIPNHHSASQNRPTGPRRPSEPHPKSKNPSSHHPKYNLDQGSLAPQRRSLSKPPLNEPDKPVVSSKSHRSNRRPRNSRPPLSTEQTDGENLTNMMGKLQM
ncbi:hypothetical protein H4R33_000552 [Dimargaris cristalligena]|nr:hypothetical protein H4R33_000552 [Dimargaris cristalligena]